MDIVKTVRLAPGRYVVAVSGGVDSAVLLDIVRRLPDVKLTVAHFDHGMRPDSRTDRRLVEELARAYGLPFVYSEGKLGPKASEAAARQARYAFLRTVQQQAGADGILTAHHQDDILETATHNLLRGTGRKGMSSLKSVDGIIRPLLHLPKKHLIDYAIANQLKWHEDSTNQDVRYRRNYIRHQLLPTLQTVSPQKYEQLKQLIRRQAELNAAIDSELLTILHQQPRVTTLRRYDVVRLPHAVGRELVGEWLRQNGKRQFGRKHLERITMAIKTGQPGTIVEVDKTYRIALDKQSAQIVNTLSM